MRQPVLASLALTLLVSFQCLAPVTVRAEGESDPLWNRPSFDKKITNIGQRILAANGISERIAFVYDREHIRNAYAKRGGGNEVVVYRDLLGLLDSDDELAAILSHEIAHIIKRHQNRITPVRAGFAMAAMALIVATGAAGGNPSLTAAAMPNFFAKPDIFTQRTLEKEADLVGLDYMVKAGYNPLAMETFMNKIVGDAGPVTRFFSTHPVGLDRLQYIHTAIINNYPQFLTPATRNNPVPGSPYQIQPASPGSPPVYPTSPVAIAANANRENQFSAISPPITANAQETKTQTDGVTGHPERYTPLHTILYPETATSPKATILLASTLGATTAGNGASLSKPQQMAQSRQSTMVSTIPSPTAPTDQSAHEADPHASLLQKPPAQLSYQLPHSTKNLSPTVTSAQDVSAGSRNQSQNSNKPSDSSLASTVQPRMSVAQTLLELQPDALRLVKLVSQRGMMSHKELVTEFETLDEEVLEAMLLDLQNNKKLLNVKGAEPDESYILTPRAASVLRPN